MSVNSDAECTPLQAPQAGPDSMSRAPACSLGAEQSPRQQQRSGSVTKATSLLSISLQEKGAQVLSSDSGNFHQASGLNPRLRQPQRAQSFLPREGWSPGQAWLLAVAAPGNRSGHIFGKQLMLKIRGRWRKQERGLEWSALSTLESQLKWSIVQ